MFSAVLSVLSGKTALVHQQRAAPVTRLSTILKDHLGSTDVIITGRWVATTFGEIRTERQSFDPWGERRDPATLALFRQSATDPFRTSSEDHDRGYTGHEQLDDSGLIHKNGRIYDPELGRMLSPDPFVQVPDYSQNFNRYSYVLNNPLNKTDPSGYSWLSEAFDKVGDWFSENWRTVVAIVVAVVAYYAAPYVLGAFGASSAAGGLAATGANATWASMAAQGAFAGAVAGGFNAGINGGDLGDVLQGAAIGAVQGAISGGVLHGLGDGVGYDNLFLHVAGHGVVGGASNEAMGGKFQDGFISAAVSAGAANAGLINGELISRTIKAGIIGGTASVLGGGKFANGAFTAAFHYLTNEAAAEYRQMLANSKPCIQCHGVSGTQLFSGNVNDFELGTLMSPTQEDALHRSMQVFKAEALNLSNDIAQQATFALGGGLIGRGLSSLKGFIFGAKFAKPPMTGASSLYDDVTRASSRYANRATDVTAANFQSNLVSSGYNVVKSTVGKNGPVTVLSNGTNTYTVYTRTSTGASGAQLTNAAGEILLKISLK